MALEKWNNDGRKKQNKRYSKGIFKPTTAEQNIDEKISLKNCRSSDDNNRTSWLLTGTIFQFFCYSCHLWDQQNIAFFHNFARIYYCLLGQTNFLCFVFVCLLVCLFPEARITGLFGAQHFKQWKFVVFSVFFFFF